jgi:hypothetical protein
LFWGKDSQVLHPVTETRSEDRGKNTLEEIGRAAEYELVTTSLRRKWASWSLPTKVAVVTGLLAAVPVLPMVWEGIQTLRERIDGPPSLTMPINSQVKAALGELDDNVDCLQSLKQLNQSELGWTKCQAKSTYLTSLSKQFSALTARDRFYESDRIYDALTKLIAAYAEINSVENSSEFAEFQKNSPLQLRDVLFLTVFLRYYYERFDLVDSSCYDISGKTNDSCQKKIDQSEYETSHFDDLTLQWENMPARYIMIGDQIAKTVGDWHSCIDGISTMELYIKDDDLKKSQNGTAVKAKILGVDGYYFDYNVSRKNVVHTITSSENEEFLSVPRMC